MSDEESMREDARREEYENRPLKLCHDCRGRGGNCPSCDGSGEESDGYTCHACNREISGEPHWTEQIKRWRTGKVERMDYCAECAPAAEEAHERALEYEHEEARDLERAEDERGSDDADE